VIVSEDTDLGALLAYRRQSHPSFVLLRSVEPLTPHQQALLLTANLPSVERELDEGAIAVLDRHPR
jgi:predicted nuclease of predicted toxin-antitoxin system